MKIDLDRMIRQILLTIIIGAVMSLAWFGAEIVIEGAVHASDVDDIVCAFYSVTMAIVLERKIWGDK